jgi:hypothetical protein
MANTERLVALQKVRIARNAIQEALVNPAVSSDDKPSLEGLVSDLDDLEDSLILGDISDKVETITQDSANLNETVAGMTAATNTLAKELSLVEDAAKALSGLAAVVSLAASHGLLP